MLLKPPAQPDEDPKPTRCNIRVVATWDNGEAMDATFEGLIPEAPLSLVGLLRDMRTNERSGD